MQAKGTALLPIPEFITTTFGYEAYKKWLNAISPEAQKIYADIIHPSEMYPLKIAVIEPTMKMCELFYNGSTEGARALGRHSADFVLRKMFKLFVKAGSPEYVLQKIDTVLAEYYQPSMIEVVEAKQNFSQIRLTKFEEPHEVIDLRIAGWLERALEISGATSVKIEITKSLIKGDAYTEFACRWQ